MSRLKKRGYTSHPQRRWSHALLGALNEFENRMVASIQKHIAPESELTTSQPMLRFRGLSPFILLKISFLSFSSMNFSLFLTTCVSLLPQLKPEFTNNNHDEESGA